MRYALLLVALLACNKAPIATQQTDNRELDVELLFTHEGCSLYRFYDGGHNHYYADCRGSTSTRGAHTESCGKGCSKTVYEDLPTVEDRR